MKTVKARRLLCILLTLCMVLPLIPVFTFAEGEAAKAKIGETEYATIQAAIDAAKNGETVDILADYSGVLTVTQKNITLNGNGHTLTNKDTTIHFVNSHVTVKNCTLTVTGERVFTVKSQKGDDNAIDGVVCSATFEGCTLNGVNNCVGFNDAQSTLIHKVTLKDCYFGFTSGGLFYGQATGKDKNVVIDIDNSTIELKNTAASIVDCWGDKNKNFTINVKNNSKLIAASRNPLNTILCPYNAGDDKTTVTLNLDNTTTVEFNPVVGPNVRNLLVNDVSGFASVTVNDAGATYKFSKYAYEIGAYYPNVTATAEQTGIVVNGGTTVYGLPAGYGVATVYRLPDGLDATNGVSVKLSSGGSTLPEVPVDMTTDAGAAASGYVCRIGAAGVAENYYKTVLEAIKAAADGATIEIITTAFENLCAGNDSNQITKTLTIKGNGNRLIGLKDGGCFFVTDGGNLTIENLDMYFSGNCGFLMRVYTEGKTPVVNLKDCTVGAYKMVLKVQSKGLSDLQTFNATNCTLTSGVDDWLLANDTQGGSVNLKLVFDNCTVSSGDGVKANQSIFKLANSTESTIRIELKNNTKLVAANTHAGDNVIFAADGKGVALTVVADNTTVFELNPGESITGNYYFLSTGKSLTFEDGGVTYKASANALKQGVNLKTVSDEIAWSVGGNELYKPGGLLKLKDATETLTLVPLYQSELGFAMVDGAAVRTDDPSGIRFISTISKKAYDMLTSCNALVEYGTYIAKTSDVTKYNKDGEFDPNLLLNIDPDSIVKITCESFAKENVDGMNQFYACLYGMEGKAGFEMEFSAVSFLTITYANDAMGLTFFTDYSEGNNARSILEVAQAAIAAGKGNDYLQSIVDACK